MAYQESVIAAIKRNLESQRLQLDVVLVSKQAVLKSPKNFIERVEGQNWIEFLDKRISILETLIGNAKADLAYWERLKGEK